MDASDCIYEQAEAPSDLPSVAKPASQYTQRTPSPPLATSPEIPPILHTTEASANPSPPAPASGPRKNRRLEFGAQVNLPASGASAEEAQEPSPTLAECSASPPISPIIHCSQYRQAQHDEEKTAAGEGNGPPQDSPMVARHAERNGASFLQDRVDGWRQRCASSDGSEALSGRYPTPPDAPYDEGLSDYSDSLCEGGRRYTANYKHPQPSSRPKSRPGPIMVRRRDQVWVRKDHRDARGLAPLCYVATGYDGSPDADDEPHRAYLCYDKRDLEWAHRLRFHLNRHR